MFLAQDNHKSAEKSIVGNMVCILKQ